MAEGAGEGREGWRNPPDVPSGPSERVADDISDANFPSSYFPTLSIGSNKRLAREDKGRYI